MNKKNSPVEDPKAAKTDKNPVAETEELAEKDAKNVSGGFFSTSVNNQVTDSIT